MCGYKSIYALKSTVTEPISTKFTPARQFVQRIPMPNFMKIYETDQLLISGHRGSGRRTTSPCETFFNAKRTPNRDGKPASNGPALIPSTSTILDQTDELVWIAKKFTASYGTRRFIALFPVAHHCFSP